jgi:hypothetical protein
MSPFRYVLALSAALVASPASAILYVCMDGDQKVFQSAPCEKPQESVSEYEVRVRRVPSNKVARQPAPATPEQETEGPSPRENCDAYLQAPVEATFSQTVAQVRQELRQRCLDRQAGVVRAPPIRSRCYTSGAITNCTTR